MTQNALERKLGLLAVLWRDFARNCAGGLVLPIALLLPVAAVIVGKTVDYAHAVRQKYSMQAAADAAALAGAQELSLSDAKRENVAEVVKQVVESHVRANGRHLGAAPVITARVVNKPQQVEVEIRSEAQNSFGPSLGIANLELHVTAVARIMGQPNICVLALDTHETGAISLESRAKMTGRNCAVFSNSSASSGLTIRDQAVLSASTICSAGGVVGQGSMIPPPYLDCPQFDDPLAGRPEPSSAGCDHLATAIVAQKRTLKPGVYCLGISIAGLSSVTFEPGVYVIKNGPFLVSGLAEIKGEGVGFYLTGAAFFLFDPLTKIELEAPKTGPMAGLLFFGSRSQSKLLINTILSSSAQKLTGTVYLPNTSLIIDSLAQVGGQSAYTAIVARRLSLLDGPHIILNTNYDETDVPVPEGIVGSGQPPKLIQ